MPRTTRTAVPPITVGRGESIDRVIFKGSPKAMSRRELHVALEPIFRPWIRAVSTWDPGAIGDYRFLVLDMQVAPETFVYVQFWSEPLEPVIWEVSSGRANPPTDEWLAGESAARIEALGFTIGGRAGKYRRTVGISSAAEVGAIAKAVVNVFLDGFEYRGSAPIRAELTGGGRAQIHETLDAFTPEDVSKVFAGLGFRVEKPVERADDEGEGGPPVIRCRKRGTDTIVAFEERVGEENLYRRVQFTADLPLPQEERRKLLAAPDAPADAEPIAVVSVVHPFGGGVTVNWLIERITEWETVLAEHRRLVRRSSTTAFAAPESRKIR